MILAVLEPDMPTAAGIRNTEYRNDLWIVARKRLFARGTDDLTEEKKPHKQ